MNNLSIKNNGNRRFGIDRREFSYTEYLPERRSEKDRRGVSGHRSIQANEGDRASFDIEQGQKGPAAANVTVI